MVRKKFSPPPTYYWLIQLINEAGDIVRIERRDTPIYNLSNNVRLLLVREVLDTKSGQLIEVTQAQVFENKLPTMFTDITGIPSSRVPEKFQEQMREVNKLKL